MLGSQQKESKPKKTRCFIAFKGTAKEKQVCVTSSGKRRRRRSKKAGV